MVAEEAAPDEATTPYDPLTQTTFRLDEVPNDSNQDSRSDQAILFKAFQLATFHSLQHHKNLLVKPFLRQSAYLAKLSKLRCLSNIVTLLVSRKNLFSNACICDRAFSVITQDS